MQKLTDILNKDIKKVGLVLEGGGARGAYQIGAIKALNENEFSYSAVVGTSIGAINGAFIAQGDYEILESMWKTLSYKDLFDIDDDPILRAMSKNLDFNSVKYLSKKLGQVIKDKGINTKKMGDLISSNISEEKLRKSNIKFGLVTFCISDMKPQELLIDNIPKGKLNDYLLATSNLPVFKRQVIDDKKYIDGGAWDNCPVGMLEKLGYTDLIVIKCYKRNRIREYKKIVKRGSTKMYMIEPIDTLPSILNFDTNNLNLLIKQGYLDTLKLIKDYGGYRYYINENKKQNILLRITNATKLSIIKDLGIRLSIGEDVSDIFYKKAVPELLYKIKEYNATTNKEAIYRLIESIAIKLKLERYKIYSFDNFINELKNSNIQPNNKTEKQIIKIIYDL